MTLPSMQKGKILIIDDEERLRSLLTRILSLEGYEVFEAGSGKDGLKKMEQDVADIVISDVKLPDVSGIDLTKKIKEIYIYTEIIVLTAYGTIGDGVTAIKNGAFDYITKGDDNDKIIPLVSKAMDKALLQKRVYELENRLDKKLGFGQMTGDSVAINTAKNLAKKVAATDTTVLLLGETGTGKEIFAEEIHQESARKKQSFVAVNCSAFTKELLESELFGYKAGAFTNALKDKKGLFEEASGGTIFLDEIGELDLDLQAKLLRVLESQQFIKIGDTKPTKVDVRIIAATNRDLETEAANGRFRSDLFYRLSVFVIKLPALRERKADISVFATFFAGYFSAKVKKQTPVLSPSFLAKLENYDWPGNIRELKNVIERVIILADDLILNEDLLPGNLRSIAKNELTGIASLDMESIEKDHIKRVLKLTNGNRVEASRLLNIGVATLYRKLKEYGLE